MASIWGYLVSIESTWGLGKLSGLRCRVAFLNLAVMRLWSGCKSPQVRAIMVAACGASRTVIGFGAQQWGSG